MDSLQVRLDGPGPPDAAAPPKRRWPKRLAVAVVVLILLGSLGTFIGFKVYAAHYQPLSTNSWQGPTHVQRAITGLTAPDGRPFDYYRLAYRDGAEVRWGFSIANDGPYAVTITAIDPVDPQFLTLLRPVAIFVSKSNHQAGTEGPFESFHPFVLPPGASHFIVVHARFGDCEFYSPGGGNTITSQSVDFTFFGVHRSVDLDTRMVMEVLSPPRAQCPRQLPAGQG